MFSRKAVAMQLPEGLTATMQGRTLVAMNAERAIVAAPLGPIAKRRHIVHLAQVGHRTANVRFGEIEGLKCVLEGQAFYYLYVGGVCIQVTEELIPGSGAESRVEEYLHTLEMK